jgi:hypothetical protein
MAVIAENFTIQQGETFSKDFILKNPDSSLVGISSFTSTGFLAKYAVELKLNPGDLCLYRGCDLYHWRPPFENKWYLQAFLHYVDGNGTYKDQLYDGRPFLAMKK